MWDNAEVDMSPRNRTSKRNVKYVRSRWEVQEFAVCGGGGEALCRAAALRCGGGALLVWAGGASAARLGGVALAAPQGAGALAAPLLGEAASAAGLARRLALALRAPVHVCCGQEFDRFTMPLIEKGIVFEIKKQQCHASC